MTALPDELYLKLLGAREALCRAQTYTDSPYSEALDRAVAEIDAVGSALLPGTWSADDNTHAGLLT